MAARTVLAGGVPLTWDEPSGATGRPRDVLIEGGKIAAVAEGIRAADADVVDVGGMIVVPGLVDTHTHLWQSVLRGAASGAWGDEYFARLPPLARYLTPKDLRAALYLGALELLNNGVTCVLDYEYALVSRDLGAAAVDGLREAGIRAVLACDMKPRASAVVASFRDDADRRAGVDWLCARCADTPLVSMAVALDDIRATRPETTVDVVGWARSRGLTMTFHNNEVGAVAALDRLGALGRDILPVHCNYVTDADLRALAGVGGTISTQPEAESYSGRRSHAMVGQARAHGIDIALGVDGPALSRPSILSQMRLLYFLQRQIDGAAERAAGRFPIARRDGCPAMSARYLARAGSLLGARAIGLAGRVGSLEVGHDADLVVIDTRPFGPAHGDPSTHLVLYSSEAEIRHVLVAGEFRKRDGLLVGADHAVVAALGAEARRRVLTAAGDAVPPLDIKP